MKSKLTIVLFIASIVGFMVRLPRVFHNYDKELHALFYFAATIVLCALYPKRSVLIAITLFIFGIAIECLQQYSNRLLGMRIHGNFDIHDIQSNTIGLVVGIVCFYIIKTITRWVKIFVY